MPDFKNVPTASVPRGWARRIDVLLSEIWELLTPEQRLAFCVTDIKEKWGELRLDWHMDAGVDPRVSDRIDAMICLASEDLRNGPKASFS